MPQPKLVLFDYDGTIARREYTYELFKRFNNLKFLRSVSNYLVKKYTEGKLPVFLEPFVYFLLLYCLRGSKIDNINDYISKTTQDYLVPYIQETIKELKSKGIKVGIVSENIQFQPRYATKMLACDLVCSNEVETREGKITGKISHFSRKKRAIKIIAEKFSLKEDEILYVGDDADACYEVKNVMFDPKRKSYLKKVDNKNCFLIKSLKELSSLLENLNLS
jgi:HAD superfamily phosphoserine phosphatase-like hydrolase